MGAAVNGTTTALGTGYRLVSVVTTGNVEASRLSRDRTQVGRSWDGDIAEVIIYNRALTEAEEARIGNYLAQKYALTVNFPGVAPDYTTNGSTWSNGYLGVFHLRETSGQHFSSTAGNAATRSVSATNQGTSTGIVGAADNFNGTSNYVNLPDFGSSPQVTVEAWVNLTAAPGSAGGGIVSSDTWAAGYSHFKATNNRSINAAINSSGTVSSPAAALPLGSWSHVAYTVSGNTSNGLALYQDGSLLGSATGQTSNNLTGLNIGREYSTRYLNAKFDEVRVSSVARSAAWLQATHATVSAPTTFANPSFVSTYAANAPAMVATRPASSITGSTATLNGNLASTGGAATTVTLYWGSSDGGTTPGNWANSIALGTLPVGNFSANLSSLTPGATYHFRAFATNTNGDSWAPDSLTFTTPTAAPTGLAFSSANGSITLQWNAVSGASGYTVKRATTSGGPYTTLLSNITGTTFIDPSATTGGTWHYVVSASNASGESANSAELSIPTLTAPANLTATSGNASVALAWTASAGATSYTVKRATTSGGPYTVQGSTAATTFNDPATNGTAYFYIVTATAAGGGFESPPSNEKSATPLASLAAPTGLAAVPATTSAILTWNTVANAQSYTLKRSTTSGGPYTDFVIAGLLSPSFTHTGLTNGTPYYYIVVAINGSITSANSAEATVIPAATPTTFTTASAGTWSTATWTPTNPIAAFATTIVLNNSGSITSNQNLGSFLFNKLQLTGQAVALSGDRLYLSGSAPAITGTNNVAHSIANPLTLDSTTTVTVPSNTLTLTGNLDGTGALLKNGAGTLSLAGLSSYSGNTTLDGGTLRHTTDNPSLKTLILGATAGSTSVSALDLTNASATSTGLVLQNNNSTANTLTIGAGETLTIAGSVFAGTYNSSTTSSTLLTATGAGTLHVSDESGQFSVGSSNSGSGVTTTVNLAALQNFNLQYPSDGGVLTLGNGSSGNTKPATLTLAANNLIELDAIQIGNNQVSSATQTLKLGSGSNILHVDSISIGTTTSPSGGGRGIGALVFNTPTGTLTLRDPSGTAGTNLFIADTGGNGNGFGSFDVTGHAADIKLASLRMGASSNTTARTDTFAFNQGTLDIVSLDVGLAQNSTNTRASQINLGGGTVTLGNGDSENPGLISLATNATGILNLTGGTVSAYQNITESTGTGSATLTLNGGSLDLLGNSIVDLTTLNLQSGTLKNVAQINGGAAITKSGSGTLVLDGTNTFTSPITISAGKLILSGSLASDITTTTGTLAPQGAPATSGSLSTSSNGRLEIRPGDTLTVGGSITLAGNLDVIAPPDLTIGTSYTILNKTTAGAITGNFLDKPEGSTFTAGGHNWQITYLSGVDNNDVLITLLTAAETWRQLHFGTTENTGNAADSIDSNNDGETNLLEFATGQNPHAATRATTTLALPPGSDLDFTYTRNKAAFDEDYLFDVQYSDTLAPNSWTSATDPGTVILNGPPQSVRTVIPEGSAGRRFIRLKVGTP